ncbi:hypothetical protein [Acinetobacter baumannii]|nr:hypothetical protein [Acinetobacter baumannii]
MGTHDSGKDVIVAQAQDELNKKGGSILIDQSIFKVEIKTIQFIN